MVESQCCFWHADTGILLGSSQTTTKERNTCHQQTQRNLMLATRHESVA